MQRETEPTFRFNHRECVRDEPARCEAGNQLGDGVSAGLGLGDEEDFGGPGLLEGAGVPGVLLVEEGAGRVVEVVGVTLELGERRGGLLGVKDGRAAGFEFDEVTAAAARVLEHRVRLQSSSLGADGRVGELLEGEVQVLAQDPPEVPRDLRRRLPVLRHEPPGITR